MKKQDIKVVVHYPKTLYGWHCLIRHAVAVWELLEQDLAGTSKCNLTASVLALDASDEEAALERYMKKHPPKKRKNVRQK